MNNDEIDRLVETQLRGQVHGTLDDQQFNYGALLLLAEIAKRLPEQGTDLRPMIFPTTSTNP